MYLKLGSRALTVYGGRPAVAVRAVLRRGWLDPDVSVLTRAFVVPGLATGLVMILGPPVLAKTWLSGLVNEADVVQAVTHEHRVLAFRMAYPVTALFWLALLMARRVARIFNGWQVRIRDEAYLMGERLHNFGGTATSSWKGRARL